VISPSHPALGSCLGRSRSRELRFKAVRKRSRSPPLGSEDDY